MIDETAITQGQHVIAGCPWHGIVRGARLWTSPTQYKDGLFDAANVRGAIRCAVPGISAVSRTPEQLSADAAAGMSWRSDAVMLLKDRYSEAYLYGAVRIDGHSLYATAPGNVFVVSLPPSQAVSADRSSLVYPATVARFGRASYAPEADISSVSVSLSGYETLSPNCQAIIDMRPDGSQSILGGISFDQDLQAYVPPWPLLGFGLLKIGGTGDAGSPITAELQMLSGNDEVASYDRAQSEAEEPTSWGTETSVEWLDDPDSNGLDSTCQMSYTRVVRGFLPPADYTQTRSASLSGYIVGWWFDSSGIPQAVTLDVSYTRTIGTIAAAEGIGSPPETSKQRYKYTDIGPASCIPNGGSVIIIGNAVTPCSYIWSGESVRSTAEELEVVLRVGGAEVDRSLTRYEHQCTYTVQGASPFKAIPSGAVYSSSERLLLGGEVIDSRVFPAETNQYFGIGASKSVLDPTDLFTITAQKSFLLGLLSSSHSLGAGRPVVSRKLHWFSNHLVCLRETVLEHVAGNTTLNRYGFTAHPGGVTAEKINSLAMLGKKPARIYGSRSPLTGEILLGETGPVTHI